MGLLSSVSASGFGSVLREASLSPAELLAPVDGVGAADVGALLLCGVFDALGCAVVVSSDLLRKNRKPPKAAATSTSTITPIRIAVIRRRGGGSSAGGLGRPGSAPERVGRLLTAGRPAPVYAPE